MRVYWIWTVACALSLVVMGASAQEQCPLSRDPEVQATERVDGAACVYLVRIDDDVYASRSFRLLVPDSYRVFDGPTRVVVDFHGTGSNKANQLRSSCWRSKAIAEGAVVAYPNGTGVPSSFSAGDYCCQTKIGAPTDDVAFTRRVVAKAQAMLGAADYRIYASGLSNGGAMAHELACEAADLLAGIAAVSQTFTKRPGNLCLDETETPVPVLDFRATRDQVIPYDGGFSLATLATQDWLSAEESLARWAETLSCGAETAITEFGDGVSHCLRLYGCDAPLVQCRIDAPHVPYSAAAQLGLDICEAAWEFWGEQSGSLLPPP